jgi:hypothetical protein
LADTEQSHGSQQVRVERCHGFAVFHALEQFTDTL